MKTKSRITKLARKLDCIDRKLAFGMTRNKGTFLSSPIAYREMFMWEIDDLNRQKSALMKMLPINLYPHSKQPAVLVEVEDGQMGYLPMNTVGSPYRIQQMREASY